MPHYTVVIGSDGPVIDLTVAVSTSWHRRLTSQGVVVPSPMTVRALIDTGSDMNGTRIIQNLPIKQVAAQKFTNESMIYYMVLSRGKVGGGGHRGSGTLGSYGQL
jgi:hypothetical protein